ncbi:iron-sulfur cluster assembly scaffold protein [Candidatus Woesearchaeota archaeon]|nr:iron-sulfur cluster assembly scaffold protein [Candidatus Woesearchaeota archaeon]|tara:strand:- start:55 stop:513 length:459 start_codon:yes stop_codon:yes gene_type:complete
MADIESKDKKQKWFYSDIVKDHFLKPRNLAEDDNMVKEINPDGIGEVGSPACGDVMKMWIKIGDGRIKKCLWKTFGCASAIASTSMLSVMITENNGMKIEDALKLRPKDILERLHGLPKIKIHCSVLGDQALRAAINDYFKRTKQEDRMVKV